ncbi:hypothetical protein DPEC_G00307270 [Dallia pectoralis]|uniref:Uncharacterized protein n=1 Tax=Dallia pectoralis TaxID=75939 RepID=A0ACC2FEI2_DALPE|nr:hypothetical protein DPEC_G00307270 [Dallia pectoralis]
MTSQGGSRKDGHAADTPPTSSRLSRPPPGPKLQVQRSLSRDTITIHFSALGKDEDDDDEELYGFGASVSSSPPGREFERPGGMGGKTDDQCILTAVEASEELLLFESGELESTASAAVLPVCSSTAPHSPALPILQTSSHPNLHSPPASSSWPSEHTRPSIPPPASSSTTSSPARSACLPSKPFLSLRSLSNEMMVAPPSSGGRHRHHLMKTFVKSISSDNTRHDHQEAHSLSQHRPVPPDSRVNNLQLFKQFSQPRDSATSGGGDSKTAPSSPITSPADGRSFFKVQEMEARIEDTRRRLSEVMCEPMHLFSKFMGDEAGASAEGGATTTQRSKSLSVSATELTNLVSLNGHSEGNNNYSIKEEEGIDTEGEEEDDTPTGEAKVSDFPGHPAQTRKTPRVSSSPPLPRSSSLALGRCFMSALARLEDEEFCELYSANFEPCADPGTPDAKRPVPRPSQAASVCREGDYGEVEENGMNVPVTGLLFITCVVYSYLVLPQHPYVCAVVQGLAAGFMLAILLLWISAAGGSSQRGTRQGRSRGEQWNVAQLDIKEPGVFKGWMNQMYSYDPEMYHATLTHSVYVRLEGSSLRLSKPNRNIARRATHNEPKPDVVYVSQKIYDLTNSKIHLVPQSLARKRIWNKKYPICIELAKQEDFMAKAQGERVDPAEEKLAGVGEKGEKVDGPGGAVGGEDPRERDLVLFLFGRTGREKEEWFRRILVASRLKSLTNKISSERPVNERPHILEADSRSSSLTDEPGQREHSLVGGVRQNTLLDYNVYMMKYVNPPALPNSPPASSPAHSPEGSPGASKKLHRNLCERLEVGPRPVPEAWVNALIGRLFWDFLVEKYWADMVSKKIQMKLSKIRLPYFMNELTLTALDMGFSIPKILHASDPSVDHQGLWFDLEVSYAGSFVMTLETKMNLARLGKEGEGPGEQGKEGPRAYCLADSDEESSSAGSSDEEDPPEIPVDMLGTEGFLGGHRPSKIMRFVDKIAKSKYFQKATETEFIKKKMEEVSNTPLLLTVEVQECRGTLAVNIPPPPTDRIWYGFRSPPHLELKARPKLGEREVTLAHVTDWIEKKLDQEFQKIFVMPNMDDLWLPIMHSATDTRSCANLATGRTTTNALRDLHLMEPDLLDM